MADSYISAQNAFPSYNWASPSTGGSSLGSSSPSFNSLYALLGSLGGSALGGLFDMFGTSNPADAAMPYLNQMQPTSYANYSPYMNTGQNSMNQLYGQVSNLGTPTGAINTMNQFTSAYEPSQYSQYQQQNMADYDSQVAAASGQAGSPSEQVALANQINNISSADEQKWLQDTFGLYNTGLQRLGDLTKLGYGATNSYDQDVMKSFMEQAGLAYAGQANKNNSSNIFSTLGSLGGMAAGFIPMMMA